MNLESIGKPKYMILPHGGFELVKLKETDDTVYKYAYGKVFGVEANDLEIELSHIALYEEKLSRLGYHPAYNDTINIKSTRKCLIGGRDDSNAGISLSEADNDIQARYHKYLETLKMHYRNAISIISPKIAAGWNRWSEEMLHLFLQKGYSEKIVWGSGNCGKSLTAAACLYVKWRVRPDKRMIVVVSKVVKDASARVYGYIKNIHAKAPPSNIHTFRTIDNFQNNGIYTLIYKEDEKKYIVNDRACIVNMPIKVNAASAEYGENLLGKHPDNQLIIAFDEAQELPGRLNEDKIFLNWYTNSNIEIFYWGNPKPISYYEPESWDLLFKAGAKFLSLSELQALEKKSHLTCKWSGGSGGKADTAVLHLSMKDSPKDDKDEINYYVERPDGTKDQRLYFLAGAQEVEKIERKSTQGTPAYYSQVLGFPFLDIEGALSQGVLTPAIVKESQKAPLTWYDKGNNIWVMGVDPSLGISSTGYNSDDCVIAIGEMGLMIDGRYGIDLHHGKHFVKVKAKEGEEFMHTLVKTMWDLSKKFNISLNRIAIETHGVGEVVRYALDSFIYNQKFWQDSVNRGQSYILANPSTQPTERPLFKQLGSFIPANEFIHNKPTEYWVATRCAVQTKQLFNIPQDALNQFYSRALLQLNTKYKIEPKRDMAKRGCKSPDIADAVTFLIEAARQNGFKYRFVVWGNKDMTDYDEMKRTQAVHNKMNIISSMLGLGKRFGVTRKTNSLTDILQG